MINWFKPSFWGNEKEYVADALASTWISDGEYIKKFEKTFADMLGVKDALTVSNGTTALLLALLSLDIKPNDEVIIPGFTFAAPANMTMATGAIPVFADVDSATWCLSSESFESCITKRTKAVIPVHLYGNICDMDKINDIAKHHGISVIEDVAEAAFSKYRDKYAGSLGDIGCFSFQATKTIAMGEGGAVVTNSDMLADKSRLIRNHGMRPEKRYWHETVGHNFRLTNMQAALGYAQLVCIDQIIANKNRVAELYKFCLAEMEGVTLQYFTSEVTPVIWAIAIKINPAYFKGDRDYIIHHLRKNNIETRPGFFSFAHMPLYNAVCSANALPNTNDISHNVISLPSYPLLTKDDIYYICEQLSHLRN